MATARSRGNTSVRERPDSPEWDFTNQKVTCTRSFEGMYADLLSQRPNIDDQMSGYEGMPVVKVGIRRAVSGKATMTVVLEIEIDQAQPQYELDWSGLEKPLEQHPIFASLFPDPTGAGDFTQAQSNALFNYNQWESATDASQKMQLYDELTDGFQKLAQKKMRGETSYIVPAPVARITTLELDLSQTTTCGKISNSVGGFPQLPPNYQWLSTADRSTRTGTYGRWQRVQEFTGADSIDSDLYGNTGGTGGDGDDEDDGS